MSARQLTLLVKGRIEESDTDPIDALEHTDAEIQAAHVYRICPFPFSSSDLNRLLGATQRTGSSGRRSVDRRIGIIIDKLIL
jgi:hypothetical protein